jgi:hypothetical protein
MRLRCLFVVDNASFRDEMRGLLQVQGTEVVGGSTTEDGACQQSPAVGLLSKTDLSAGTIRRLLVAQDEPEAAES